MMPPPLPMPPSDVSVVHNPERLLGREQLRFGGKPDVALPRRRTLMALSRYHAKEFEFLLSCEKWNGRPPPRLI